MITCKYDFAKEPQSNRLSLNISFFVKGLVDSSKYNQMSKIQTILSHFTIHHGNVKLWQVNHFGFGRKDIPRMGGCLSLLDILQCLGNWLVNSGSSDGQSE